MRSTSLALDDQEKNALRLMRELRGSIAATAGAMRMSIPATREVIKSANHKLDVQMGLILPVRSSRISISAG